MSISITINDIAPNGIVINSGATYSGSVLSGGILVLPNVTNYDSDGSAVVTPAIVGFTATTCDPVTIINSGATYSASTPAGSTFVLPNQTLQIEDLTGGTIDSITFPVYSDPVINFSAYCQSVTISNSGSTYNQTIQSGSGFTLPNITHIDSDGSNVTLPAQTPFTATTCATGCTDEYCRPSDWLPMPDLVDGDDQINLLSAVWEDAPNLTAFIVTTSAGNYTVDWGDGNSDTYASGVQAEHEYEYSAVTNDSVLGYRQAMITVSADTGNLTTFIANANHSSATTANNTGFLDCKVASQTITSLASAFSSLSGQRHSYLDKFEFVGTCNVTNLSNMFYSSNIQYVIGQFTACTNATSMFQESSIQYMDMALGSSTICTSMFRSATLRHFKGCDVSGANNMTSMFRFSEIFTFGSADSPIVMPSSTSMATMFYLSTELREIYMTETSPTSTSQTFRDCENLIIIEGLNMSGTSTTSLVFDDCYSLSRAVSSGLTLTVSYDSCNLSREGIVDIFNGLGTSVGQTITVTNNPGSGDLTAADELIATSKGWFVVY